MKQSATLARLSKKTVAFLAAATTLFAGLSISTVAPQEASAATRDSYADTVGNPTFEAARKKYGLPKDMKDGATLHAFDWSFKTIMENIPDIAKAGYTSIQTDPIVKIKDNRKLGTGNWNLNWYYVYQPTDMSIGNYVLGSEDEFKEMCALAHQYGLRIIVDSVSNHFTSDFDVIAKKWQNKSFFHTGENISDYNNREDCTQHKLSGLWDLNTQDDTVTEGMHDLLVQTVADGADGFRYDAAKHIELSDEVFGGKKSNYWNTILQNGSQYQYGEVLEDSNVREGDYANMFDSSSPRGGGITDSKYGEHVRNAVQHGNLGAGNFTGHSKMSESQSVNWVESHDNFANQEANIPTEINDEWLKYGWAGITAQKNGMTLFFDRPYKDGGEYGTGGKGVYADGGNAFTENSKLGDAGSDLWKDPEVVAVNHFRNAMVGEDSNVSNCGDENCLMVERYAGSAAQDGMVVANANGTDKNLAGTGTKLANGTYTDEVTGSTITVSGGKITSGTVKGKSIAAFSNKTRSGKVSTAEAYPNKGTIPGESKLITLRSYQASRTTYSTSDGQSGSYKDGDTIKIGASAKADEVVTVTVKGTGADGEAIKHTYSYTKYGDPTYDPNDGTESPCDKDCQAWFKKNNLDPDCYINSREPCHWRNVNVTGIKVSGPTSMDLGSTQSVQLKADVTTNPAGKRANVTWTSSDTSVATVDSTGKVSGLKAGTVKITATAGTNQQSDSITIKITGVKPELSNVIYATKPAGWDKVYAYVYNDTTSKNNGKWPGVAMTQLTADDSCAKAGTYKYEVPDLGEGTYRVIFTNGSGSQTPGASQPGIEFSGKVSWDGTSATVSAVTCNTTQPILVSSVSVSGDGVKEGKLTLKSGASVQLTATVNPSNATDRKVTWTSSDSGVANVMGTGVVTAGSKAGTATVTASAGGKSASVTVTVASAPKQPMTIWYKPASSWKTVKVNYKAAGKWSDGAQAMTAYRDGWYRYTVPDTAGGQVRMAFTNGGSWDNNGGKDYYASGSVASVSGGKVSSSAPSFAEPMTIYYKAPSSWKTVKVNYKAAGKWSEPTSMSPACGGWWRITVPDTAGGQVRMAFGNGSTWDNNGGKDYYASGDSVAVSGGQLVTDVTPNCAIKQ